MEHVERCCTVEYVLLPPQTPCTCPRGVGEGHPHVADVGQERQEIACIEYPWTILPGFLAAWRGAVSTPKRDG